MSAKPVFLCLIFCCSVAQVARSQHALLEEDLRVGCIAEASFLVAALRKYGPAQEMTDNEINGTTVEGFAFAWFVQLQERFRTASKQQIKELVSREARQIVTEAHDVGSEARIQAALDEVDRCVWYFDRNRTNELLQLFREKRG